MVKVFWVIVKIILFEVIWVVWRVFSYIVYFVNIRVFVVDRFKGCNYKFDMVFVFKDFEIFAWMELGEGSGDWEWFKNGRVFLMFDCRIMLDAR